MSRSVDCPTCDAPRSFACTDADGRPLAVAHPDRVIAERTETMAALGRMAPPSRFPWRRQ